MKISKKLRKHINAALDFKRDSDIGYMLTDNDIISGIVFASDCITYDEAELILAEIRAERKV